MGTQLQLNVLEALVDDKLVGFINKHHFPRPWRYDISMSFHDAIQIQDWITHQPSYLRVLNMDRRTSVHM